jgi:UTP:GlnB (protein PII) uridylyltransferase
MVEQPESDNTDIQPLLADLRAALEALYGDRLVRLVLYGSQARGDAHAESDVDVLVVLEGPVQPGREIRRMSTSCFEVGLKHEAYISALPVSAEAYHSKPSAWLQNVRREGISL